MQCEVHKSDHVSQVAWEQVRIPQEELRKLFETERHQCFPCCYLTGWMDTFVLSWVSVISTIFILMTVQKLWPPVLLVNEMKIWQNSIYLSANISKEVLLSNIVFKLWSIFHPRSNIAKLCNHSSSFIKRWCDSMCFRKHLALKLTVLVDTSLILAQFILIWLHCESSESPGRLQKPSRGTAVLPDVACLNLWNNICPCEHAQWTPLITLQLHIRATACHFLLITRVICLWGQRMGVTACAIVHLL